MILYYSDHLTTIYHGDSTSLTALEPDSVDLTITSPPYNLEIEYDGYADALSDPLLAQWMREWLAGVYRVTRDGGRLCLNIPLDTNKGGKRAVYADYVALARHVGWRYQTTIVWNEQNISRRTAWGSWCKPSAPFVTAPVEMIVVLHKGEWRRPPFGRRSTITPKNFQDWTLGLWTFSGVSPRVTGHPAAFPAELPRRLIHLYSYTTDVILDPFLGSGTTCRVARQLGRKSIGAELSGAYCALAVEGIEYQDADTLISSR